MLPVSEKGYAAVAAREACVLTMYPDSHSPAIGFGLNDRTLKSGDTITLERAIELMLIHGHALEQGIARAFPDVTLPQNTVDALFSGAYNVGISGLVRDNPDVVEAVRRYAAEPTNKRLRDLAGYALISLRPKDTEPPFNFSRRCREALILVAGDYGDLSHLMLWEGGKHPNIDQPSFIPMPKFLKG